MSCKVYWIVIKTREDRKKPGIKWADCYWTYNFVTLFMSWLGPWSWGAPLDSNPHLTIIKVKDLPFYIRLPLFLSTLVRFLKLCDPLGLHPPNFVPIRRETTTELGHGVTNLTAYIVWLQNAVYFLELNILKLLLLSITLRAIQGNEMGRNDNLYTSATGVWLQDATWWRHEYVRLLDNWQHWPNIGYFTL